MPSAEDDDRVVFQSTRYEFLDGREDEIIRKWLAATIGERRAARWGIPDTSVNTLSQLCRQLTTPGLYGTRPELRHAAPKNLRLIGPGGHLDRAGYFVRMQRVQYFVLGMGDYFLRPDVNLETRELFFRNVLPQNVCLFAEPEQPDRPTMLAELRPRWWAEKKCWTYAWDCYDVGCMDPLSGEPRREPSYRVFLPGSGEDGWLGDDVSNVFLGVEGGYLGRKGMTAYPYRTTEGLPVLPFVRYRSSDNGGLWNHLEMRGALRGAMLAMGYFTYAGNCARNASGSTVIVSGLIPPAGAVEHAGEIGATQTMELEAGAMVFCEAQEGAQPMVTEVGPGGHLDDVSEWAMFYSTLQGLHYGLNPSDMTRQHANPQSGQALFLSTKQKREAAARYEPLFRQSDLEAIRLSAIVLRAAQVDEDLDESGYSILYPEIPESPEEERERRDRSDWEEGKGYLSPIDGYLRWHPGASREVAIAAMVAARVDKAQIDAATSEALAAMGVETGNTDEKAQSTFNELTLGAERLARLGDVDGVNAIRQAAFGAIGVNYPGDLSSVVPPAPESPTEEPTP